MRTHTGNTRAILHEEVTPACNERRYTYMYTDTHTYTDTLPVAYRQWKKHTDQTICPGLDEIKLLAKRNRVYKCPMDRFVLSLIYGSIVPFSFNFERVPLFSRLCIRYFLAKLLTIQKIEVSKDTLIIFLLIAEILY